MTVAGKKILLVLDVNGLLLDTYAHEEKKPLGHPPGAKVGKYRVYRRPFCDEFLEFCFENFAVGIWSSARQYNVDILVDFIFRDSKRKLLFSWNQSDCTDTGLKTPENKFKPLFLKELSKLWNKVKPGLPWEKGEYGPSNTLLIDDTPYKALRNPPNTAIFPYPYKVGEDPENILGGALRKYLEGLLTATSVQCYVENHPFGQIAITTKDRHWNFYKLVLVGKEPVNVSKEPVNNSKKKKRKSSIESGIRTLEILQATNIHQHSAAGVVAKANGVFDIVAVCNAGSNGSHRTSFSQNCEANEMSQNVIIELWDGKKDILENKEVNLLEDNCAKDLPVGLHDESLLSNSKRKKKHKKNHTDHQDGHIKNTGGKHSSSSQYIDRDLLKEKKAHSVHVQRKKDRTDRVDKHRRQDFRQLEEHHIDNFHLRQFGRGNYSQPRLPVDLQNYYYGSNQSSEVLERGFQDYSFLNENSTTLPFIPFAQSPLLRTMGQNSWPNTSYNAQYQARSQWYNRSFMHDNSQSQMRYNKNKKLSEGDPQHYHNHYRRKRFEKY